MKLYYLKLIGFSKSKIHERKGETSALNRSCEIQNSSKIKKKMISPMIGQEGGSNNILSRNYRHKKKISPMISEKKVDLIIF